MLINDKPLTDNQIIKEFLELVKENGEVKFNINDPVRLSDYCIKEFTYQRVSGSHLYKILDRYETESYLTKENICIKRNGGYIIFSYVSGKKQTEENIIKQFIKLVQKSKKITLNPSHPSSSPKVANLMQENNLSDIDFGYMLNEYNDLIRKNLLVIERDNIRRFSTL
ncbi:hypothetical protein M3205_03645 [Cytobacillus firmus]|uniref:hypothetical protein n=1 Tax=Cytobacillus firmus TaxID=1399 RepID=UPI00203A58A7|nr:hypothetical protein [Cytobacillus firmus]MCM3704811.1 hypothetical protein [Cytobacillus firmus]